MTLVLAGAIGGKYSITTGDTRRSVGKYWVDPDTGAWGVEEGWERTDLVVNKVGTLSNFVTYAQVGNSDITEYIIGKLKDRVSKSFGVLRIALILQEVIAEMRAQKEAGGVLPFFFNFLDEDDKFAVLLNGFTNEIIKGKSYFAFYISGFDKDVHTEEVEEDKYSYVMFAPAADYARRKSDYMDIDFGPAEKEVKVISSRFLMVHAVISSLQPDEVSALCDCQVMRWVSSKANPLVTKERMDVTGLYDELGLNNDAMS